MGHGPYATQTLEVPKEYNHRLYVINLSLMNGASHDFQ